MAVVTASAPNAPPPTGPLDRTAPVLDWAIAAAFALTIVVVRAGIDVDIAGINLRAHSPIPLAIISAVLLLMRIRLGARPYAPWTLRLAMMTAICGSVAAWFRFMLSTLGGADSWGYVSASRMLAAGRLIEPAPVADLLSAANRLALAAPLGWTPAPDGTGVVPTYPIGTPLVMALFSVIGGADAVYLVTPVTGVITLWLVYRLTRTWHDAETALVATALVAWNPLVIAYAKQPMSDMPASMWTMTALVLAARSSSASALGAGLAAGAAVLTRPVLLVAGAVMPLLAYRGPRARHRLALAGAGLTMMVLVLMTIQDRWFGSPFSTGYGSSALLFSAAHAGSNLAIFGRHGWAVLGPVVMAGLIAGFGITRRDTWTAPLAVFVAVTLPYLFYLPFDHWETLRFLLPGLVPLTIVAAAGLVTIARRTRHSAVTAAVLVASLAVVVVRSDAVLRTSSAWDIAAMEARYPMAGAWTRVNTPPNAVVMAVQHSGSLRWYGERQTIRWDFIAPEHLTTTVRDLQEHGAAVYVALEGDEAAAFDRRFAGQVDSLQVDHVGSVGPVSFRRLR